MSDIQSGLYNHSKWRLETCNFRLKKMRNHVEKTRVGCTFAMFTAQLFCLCFCIAKVSFKLYFMLQEHYLPFILQSKVKLMLQGDENQQSLLNFVDSSMKVPDRKLILEVIFYPVLSFWIFRYGAIFLCSFCFLFSTLIKFLSSDLSCLY